MTECGHVWVVDGAGFACSDCGEHRRACAVVGRGVHPADAAVPLCRRHEESERRVLDGVERHLAGVPWNRRQYWSVLEGTAFDGDGARGGPDPDRLPFGLDLVYDDWWRGVAGVQTADGAHSILDSWVSAWREASGSTSDDEGLVFLRRMLLWAAGEAAASGFEDFRREMRVLRRRLSVLDEEAPARVGPHCLRCGGDLVGVWSESGVDTSDGVRCETCLQPYSLTSYRMELRAELERRAPSASPDALVSFAEIRLLYPSLSEGTFRSWVKRDRDRARRAARKGEHVVRRLPARGSRGRAALYRLGDVASLMFGRAVEDRATVTRGRRAESSGGI